MAASTSTSRSAGVYDVFINHRGPDVKMTFASHLYRRLISYGLQVFIDNQELEKGQELEPQIKGAIASASVHIAIFSPRYAESKWCLEELHLMLETKSPIIPVFYKVEVADLKRTHEQDKGIYGLALNEHEKKIAHDGQPRYKSTTVEKWRKALFNAAEIIGFTHKFNDDEGELVDKVVELVLNSYERPQLDVAEYPTGLEEKAHDFERRVSSQQNSGRVQVVLIAGLGGVGKTTLAKQLFNKKRSKYREYYFLSDVRENVVKSSLHSLQRELLNGLLHLRKIRIDNIHEGIGMLKKHLSSLQILLVLDDVDNAEQVDALLQVNVLHPDSFILITSRDKDVLRMSRIKESSIYELTGLDEHLSRQLFSSYAFCQPQLHPPARFESLVDRFLKACQGLPLSLKVFGGLVSGNDKSDWEDHLKKLEQILPEKIQERLQISYDALGRQEKQMFLDIACFFIGEEKDKAINIWNGSKWTGKLGFQILQNKCLVELDMENKIRMHDHLRDLGRDLAKLPEFPRRLWRGIEDIDDLRHHSFEVRGIRVCLREDEDDDKLIHQMILNEDGDDHSEEEEEDDEEDEEDDSFRHRHSIHSEFQRRKLLRGKLSKLLQLNKVVVTKLQLLDADILTEDILSGLRSPNLIWFRWQACHLSSLPPWIPLNNLWVLEVQGNKLKTLWQHKSQVPLQLRELRIFAPLSNLPDYIGKLKHLERIVVHSFDLEELPKEFGRLRLLKALVLNWCSMRFLPDFLGDLTNLEHIDLSSCAWLERLPDSFKKLERLKYLELSGCTDLTISSHTLGNISTLEYIGLDCCDNIEVLPYQFAHQRYRKVLNLHLRKLKELPSDIGKLSALEELLIECPLLETLPPSIGDLSKLKRLRLLRCPKLKELPSEIGKLSALEMLVIRCSRLKTLPPSIRNLSNLKDLEVLDCNKLKGWPDSIRLFNHLTVLIVNNCSFPERLFKKTLEGESEKYCMPGLQHLELVDTKFDKVSFSEGVCPNLQELLIRSCSLQGVGTLPNALVLLRLADCSQLRKIEGLCGLTKLQRLEIYNCREVEELPGFETLASLEVLRAQRCNKLKSIRGSAEITKLGKLEITNCSDLEELQGVENFRLLEMLDVSGCEKLKNIPGLAQLTKLRTLKVSGCFDLELHGVENLRSLVMLDVSGRVKLNNLEELEGVENLEILNDFDLNLVDRKYFCIVTL